MKSENLPPKITLGNLSLFSAYGVPSQASGPSQKTTQDEKPVLGNGSRPPGVGAVKKVATSGVWEERKPATLHFKTRRGVSSRWQANGLRRATRQVTPGEKMRMRVPGLSGCSKPSSTPEERS